MKELKFFLLLVICFGCNTEKNSNMNHMNGATKFVNNESLQIGQNLNSIREGFQISKKGLLSDKLKSIDCYEISLDEVLYKFSIDKNKAIEYICTFDQDFETKEGVKIGMFYNEIVKKGYDKVMFIDGFGSFITLPSGWNAVFKVQDINDIAKAYKESSIHSFFKSKVDYS